MGIVLVIVITYISFYQMSGTVLSYLHMSLFNPYNNHLGNIV